MGYWFGFKRSPLFGVYLILVTVNITTLCITSSEILALEADANAKNLTLLSNYNYIAQIDNDRTSLLGEKCNTSFQCSDRYAECEYSRDKSRQVCRCKKDFEEIRKYNVSICAFLALVQPNRNPQIYKAAMAVLACFILIILGLFLMFVSKRAIQNRRFINGRERSGSNSSARSQDIFSVCDQLARERVRDKPPTYEDVALADRKIVGMPPPIYSANEEESPFSNAAIALRTYTSSNEAIATVPSSSPSEATVSEEVPSFYEVIAAEQTASLMEASRPTRTQGPSSNGTTATEQSPSEYSASSTSGHHNQAFVCDL